MVLKNLDGPFFRFPTMHAFDRRTNRQLSRSYIRAGIPCSVEKIEANVVVSECTAYYRIVITCILEFISR